MTALDVVIPSYNRPAAMVAQAVRSALDFPATARVILVDDGSSPPVDRAALPGDPRLTLIRQPNAGPSAARNAGLDASASDLVAFLDDDDAIIPEGLGAMIDAQRRFDAALVCGGRLETRLDGEIRLQKIPPEWADRPLPRRGDIFRPVTAVSTSIALLPRRVVASGLRFDLSLKIGEDRDFFFKAGALGPIVFTTPAAVRLGPPGRADQLTSPRHMDRRALDHAALLERYCSVAAPTPEDVPEHWRAATTWLLKQCAKAGVSRRSWSALSGAARARGWPVPLKARLRRALWALRPN